jgi:hypothetical protein
LQESRQASPLPENQKAHKAPAESQSNQMRQHRRFHYDLSPTALYTKVSQDTKASHHTVALHNQKGCREVLPV